MKIKFVLLAALILAVGGSVSAQVNNARMLSAPNAQTGVTYTFVSADTTRVTTFTNASPVAVTLPNGATLGFGAGTMLSVANLGAGAVTITCTSCTINGLATLVLSQNQGADIYGGSGSPAVNYIALFSPSGVGPLLNGNNAFTGNNTHSGVETFQSLGNIKWANSSTAGADCGAKIMTQDAALGGSSGEIWVDSSCGTGSSSGGWSAVSLSAGHKIRIVQAATYWISGAINLAFNAGIFCTPSAVGNSSTTCMIKAANGTNLPAMVSANGTTATLRDFVLDGNQANNPTGGVCYKINSASQSGTNFFTAQNCPTHGIWISSTVGGNQSQVCSLGSVWTTLNNQDGILIQNTGDCFLDQVQSFNNGISPVVNTQNAATGGCSANCVTWVSGSKWSTDSSLVGTRLRINGVLYAVSSIQSTTVLTISAAPGTQTSVAMSWGNALEDSDSPTLRITHADLSGNSLTGGGMDGVLGYCTVAGIGLNGLEISSTNLANNQNDIEIVGYDPVGAANCAFGAVIVGNFFLGGSQGGRVGADNTYDSVKIIDGGRHVIGPNYYNSSPNPFRGKYAVELTETASGRAVPNVVYGYMTSGFGSGAFNDTNLNKSAFSAYDQGTGGLQVSGNVFLPNAQNISWRDFSGTLQNVLRLDSNNNVYLFGQPTAKSVNIRPAGTGGTDRAIFTDTGASLATGLFPTVDNTDDFGSTATRWRNLFISGTVQTATATMGLTLKKGSGSGNYTNATTSYAVADSSNLCFTVTIPTGWKLGISASGGLSTATAAVVAQAALTDNAACSTANAGILVETAAIQGAGIGIADAFALNWIITGDGNSHNIALQFKTSNASDTASLMNSSATTTPTMKFELMPSN